MATDLDKKIACGLRQIAEDMRQATAGGMSWIDHGESEAFRDRINGFAAELEAGTLVTVSELRSQERQPPAETEGDMS